MSKDEATTELSGCSDADLMEGARAGGHAPLAELWRRHHRAGLLAARRCTSSIDPDDLVSEAFARIIRALHGGGGPRDAFRPYLYATIRNVAARWASTERSVAVGDWTAIEGSERFEQLALLEQVDEGVVRALERTLTARAFRSLPERWQTVLWYTEVEGLDPHEAAPLLGLSPNAVAALAYRARDALRTAWLQAHIADSRTHPDCAWSVARLGEHARDQLPPTQTARMADHLAGCPRCTILAEELDDLASRAALVLVPLLLGATATGAAIGTSAATSGTVAASAPAVPVVSAPPLPMAASAAVTSAAVTGAVSSHGAAAMLAPAVIAMLLALGMPASSMTESVGPAGGAGASSDDVGRTLGSKADLPPPGSPEPSVHRATPAAGLDPARDVPASGEAKGASTAATALGNQVSSGVVGAGGATSDAVGGATDAVGGATDALLGGATEVIGGAAGTADAAIGSAIGGTTDLVDGPAPTVWVPDPGPLG